jgi:hypothetical protein
MNGGGTEAALSLEPRDVPFLAALWLDRPWVSLSMLGFRPCLAGRLCSCADCFGWNLLRSVVCGLGAGRCW